MKKQFAIFLMGLLLIHTHIFGYFLEVNGSYDHFRGMPDGSWNGNNGAVASVNIGAPIYQCIAGQIGGSYGLYNWDGRQSQVFCNPTIPLQQGFITAGIVSNYGAFRLGVVYDRMFTDNYGIYSVNPSLDQVRFHGGYKFSCEEVGVWGTAHITTIHKSALGLPLKFRAIDQMNLFWTHQFRNCAKTTVWAGIPYRCSVMFPSQLAGTFIAGVAIRAPLTKCLYFDGHGSYMGARSSGVVRARNYNANICLGITYLFGNSYCGRDYSFLPVANNTNFMVDTNLNQ